MGLKDDITKQMFRAGVGAVIINRQGKLLALERRDIEGAWQLPQGGLQEGEEPGQAVYRELKEETGLTENEIEFLARASHLLAYELPPALRSEKTGRGQVHYWYLFAFKGDDQRITLGDKKEFRAWQWLSWNELFSLTVDFRKQLYRQLKEEFSHLGLKQRKAP